MIKSGNNNSTNTGARKDNNFFVLDWTTNKIKDKDINQNKKEN